MSPAALPPTSSKLDAIAQRILYTAGLISTTDGDSDGSCIVLSWVSQLSSREQERHPFLAALEKSLDVYDDAETVTATAVKKKDGESQDEEIWSPPSDLQGMEYTKYASQEEFPSLEDSAPFSPTVYLLLGQLLIHATHSKSNSSTSSTYHDDTNNERLKKQRSINSKGFSAVGSQVTGMEQGANAGPMEDYSLNKSVDSIRVVTLLSQMQELNVLPPAMKGKGQQYRYRRRNQTTNHVMETDVDVGTSPEDEISFLDLFLYYNEGNTNIVNLSTEPTFPQGDTEVKVNPQPSQSMQPPPSSSAKAFMSKKRATVPILTALFRHVASFSQLEGLVHSQTRKFRASHGGKPSNIQTCTLPNSTMTTQAALTLEHLKSNQDFQSRLEMEFQSHVSLVESLLYHVYRTCDATRRLKCRIQIGSLLQNFTLVVQSGTVGGVGGLTRGVENTSAAGIESILGLLRCILRGASSQSDLNESYRLLMLEILLPLHKPCGMVLWRDQTPLLGLYHKPLVQCMGTILSLDLSLMDMVVKGLLHPDIWPLEGKGKGMANTPKLVLLLHEIDTYISLLPLEDNEDEEGHPMNDARPSKKPLSQAFLPLVLRLASCISSDNSRSSERALEFFKNKKFKILVKLHLSRIMTPLLRALFRVDAGMEVPWNPTVRKMTLLVLQDLKSYNEAIYNDSCAYLFRSTGREDVDEQDIVTTSQDGKSDSGSILVGRHDEAPSAGMVSLKNAMGTWKPPNRKPHQRTSLSMPPPNQMKKTNISSRLSGGLQPPLTVTGVAPWAMSKSGGIKKISQPPLTVTGVAPWAVRGNTGLQTPRLPRKTTTNETNRSRRSIPPMGGSSSKSSVEQVCPINTNPVLKETPSSNTRVESRKMESQTDSEVMKKVESFIEKLKPPHSASDGESEDGVSKWALSQMSESPVLLPDLKFHDLVFGQTLGTGAFSTVRYSRQINKDTTRSHWSEYAVKIVSTHKIQELGYEQSINREIAILRIMHHPGIARLVSSFRFRDGAYLVLEHCSGGDLHTLLKQNGSLDEDSTIFVVGEVIASISSIHDLDFVYGDLKPENILVTESGHVKVTDFGACRPLTHVAKQKLREAGRNIIKTLRDGDWRKPTIKDADEDHVSDDGIIDKSDEEDDDRIEGTTAYLPPEVVLGERPTKAADSWALGCVMYQCLSGRPPLLEDTEALTRKRIVSFEAPKSPNDTFFGEERQDIFNERAKDLIKKLLCRNASQRLNMDAAGVDPFFKGLDVYSFYKDKSRHLDAGSIAPVADAKWTRRQFSSIWSPQPQAYSITSDESPGRKKSADDVVNTPIAEGDEAEGFFLTRNKNRMLLQIKEI